MITLQDILSDENKVKSILEIASLYGFKNIRISKETATTGVLTLIVSTTTNEPGYDSLLAASLAKGLGCQVNILPEQYLKISIKDKMLNQSAAIDNLANLQSLFGQSLDKFILNPAVEDYSFLAKRRERSANEILALRNKKLTDFFPISSKLLKNGTISVSDKQEKLIDFFSNCKNHATFDKFFHTLSPEVVEQMDNARRIASSQEEFSHKLS